MNEAATGTIGDDRAVDLLKDLLITELGRAGVLQAEIRKIVGCGINRLSRIVKNFGKDRGKTKGKDAGI